MSTLVNISSVCGKVTTQIDIYDLDLNPHGVICCDNCESILISRKSFEKLYSQK